MSYTAPTVTSGNVIDDALFEALVVEHRRELNNDLLTGAALQDGAVTAYGVEAPEFKPVGSKTYEHRGVSGGIKWVEKSPANFSQVVDRLLVDPNYASTAFTTTASTRRVWSKGGTEPANSIIAPVFHQTASTATDDFYQKATLPGVALTVEIDKPATVKLEGKITLNYLPSNLTTDYHNITLPDVTHVVLPAYEDPAGNRQAFEASGQTQGFAFGRKSQTLYDVRDFYFTCYLDVDGATNQVGDYSFVLIPHIQTFTSDQGALQFDTEVALIGKSTLSVEFFYY